MEKSSKNTKISIVLVGVLLIGVMVFSAVTTDKNQKFSSKNRASGTEAKLSLVLNPAAFQLNETKTVSLQLTFNNPVAGEKLDALQTKILFPKECLRLTDYVDISTVESAGLNKIFRLDGPTAANDLGAIIISIGASEKGKGPSTGMPVIVAQMKFNAYALCSAKTMSITSTEVVNNASAILDLSSPQNLTFSVTGSPPGSSSSSAPPASSSSSSTPASSSSSSSPASSSSSSTASSCICNANSTCHSSCSFTKVSGKAYANPIKCSLSESLFGGGVLIPNQTDKNSWCARIKRTQGDTNGDNLVNSLDLGYYSNAVNGRNIPVKDDQNRPINPDINGDGLVSVEDREIIITSIP